MKSSIFILLLTATLAGCVPASISQSFIARPLLNETTVGGPGYPIVVEGAESVGLSPMIIAQNLRFPNRLGAGSSFRAITPDEAPSTYARIQIEPGQPLAPSTLTFLHGERRIGVGTFSIAPQAYADPTALGAVSATLITDMLHDARRLSRGDNCFLHRCN